MWSEGDVAYALEFYARTYSANGRETSAESFVKGTAAFLTHFEDFTATVNRLFRVDNPVMTRVVYRGRHVGDFPGVPAVGARVELTGLDVFRLVDERAVEHLHEADHEAMWEQLGVTLPPG